MIDVTYELNSYFGSGAVVCPHAQRVQYAYFNDFDFDVERWVSVVSARAAAVVLSTGAARSFDEARVWALAAHGRLCRAVGSEPVTHLNRVLPHVEVGALSAYAIGMGPQYPVEHPRYAPWLCLVSVNGQDVRDVSPQAREPIRRAMVARAGARYDADEVWLPVNLREQGATT